MKKLLLSISLMLLAVTSASAQGEKPFFGLGNRVGVGVGIGTEGIGFDAAVSLNKYFQARVGVKSSPTSASAMK